MKVNELRVGNFFMCADILIKCNPLDILALYQYEIANSKNKNSLNISNIEIPLSEEWLVDNAGFEKDDCYGVFKYLNKHEYDTDKLSFRDSEGFMCLHIMQYRSLLKHIKYVHLFQNLWNGLTGIECDILQP